jgi:phage-related minor tail protein
MATSSKATNELHTQIVAGMDVGGIETGVEKGKQKLAELGIAGKSSAKLAAEGFAEIGKSGDEAAEKISTATKRAAREIESLIVATRTGEMAGARVSEELSKALTKADFRGANTDFLKPYIAELERVKILREQLNATAAFDKAAEEAAAIVRETQAMQQAAEVAERWNRALKERDALNESFDAQNKAAGIAAKQDARDAEDFAKQHAEAAKLAKDSEYVRAWQQALEEADRAAKELAATEAFEKQHQAARQLVKDSEYIRQYEDELQKLEATQRQMAQGQSFLDSLNSRISQHTMSPAELLEQKAAMLGVSEQAKPLIDRLRTLEKGFDDAGASAGLMARRLALVGPQVTDVITQLEMGANPLTILVQQGGQLIDIFGGVKEALKGLADFLSNLIKPWVLVAGAVALLTTAYFQGAKEADEFQQTLVMTGNAAGTSVQQLQGMASAMTRLGQTQHAAAAALNEMAKSGKVSSGNLQQFTQVALDMERTVGQAVKETAKQFADLGNEPVKASVKLNEATNYLTREIYDQIKALEEQGRTAEAASLAQQTYADAMRKRTGELTENLGYIEKAWKLVTGAAKGAWDAMLGVGRETNFASRLDEARRELQTKVETGPTNQMPQVVRAHEEGIKRLREEIYSLSEIERLQKRGAEAEAERAQMTKDHIKWQEDIDKLSGKYIPKVEREKQLQEKINAVKAEGLRLGEADWEIQAKIAKLKDDYSNKSEDSAAKKAARAAAKELEDQKKLILELAGLTTTFTEDWDRLTTIYKAGKISLDQLVERQATLLKQQPGIKKETEAEIKRNVELYKQQLETQKEIGEQEAKDFAERTRLRLSIDEYVRSLEEANGAAQVELAYMGQSETARKIAIEQYKIQIDLKKRLREIDKSLAFDSEEQREAERARLRAAADQSMVAASQKVYLDEWAKTSDQIGQALANSLMEGGKSASEYIRDLFRTMVLKPIVQAIVQPVMGSIAGAFAPSASNVSADGTGQVGQSSGVSFNTVSSLSTAANMIRSAMGGVRYVFGTGSTSLMGDIGIWVNEFGTKLGSTVIQQFGNGMNVGITSAGGAEGVGAQFASAASTFMAAYAGRALGQMISGGYSAWGGASGNSAVNTGTAAGAVIGSIFPVIGTAIGALVGGIIGGIVNRVFGRKLADVGLEGTFSSEGFSGNSFQFFKGGWFRSDKTDRSPLEANIDNGLDVAIKSLHAQTKAYGDALGLPVDALKSVTTQIRISTWELRGMKPEDAQKRLTELLTAELDKANEALAEKLIGPNSPYALLGETAGQTLARLATTLTTVNDAFRALGVTLLDASIGSANVAQLIADAFGGLDKFGTAVQGYYDSIYSDAQKLEVGRRNLKDAFAAMGLGVPATAQQYKDLVEQQNLYTQSGRNLYSALVQLAPAWRQIQDAADAQTNAFNQERLGLEQQLLQLQGNTVALRERELAALQPGNRDLQQRIWRLQDEQKVAQERAGLEQQLLQAQGNTAALRERELAALDPANRALQQQVWLMEDTAKVAQQRAGLEQQYLQLTGNTAELRQRELAALDPVNRALQTLIYQLTDAQKVAQERAGLEQQLLEAQGDTAALRARELAALDPANRALQTQIWLLEDAAKQAEELQKLRDAWKAVGDTIASEIRRIRSLNDAEDARSYVQLQAQFATTTAQARAGDQEAAKLLPDLSRALLDAANDSAGTAQELATIQAATAASLEQTMRLLQGLGVEVPQFAAGGDHPGGARIVGEQGPELEVTGQSHIFDAETTARLLSGGVTVEELRAIVAELRQLREDQRVGHARIADNTGRAARVLETVSPDGDAITIKDYA